MSRTNECGCDLLVISPHPDDAEIGLGGTLKLLSQQGRKCWVVDLTAGELGSNATPEIRWQEACASSEVLGIEGRARLNLPDGFIDKTDQGQVSQVAHVIRCLKPRWVITAPDAVRHPDHKETPLLVAKAIFMAGLVNFNTSMDGVLYWPPGSVFPEPAERWKVLEFGRVCAESEKPSFFFDVSTCWEAKSQSIACFASQFHRSSSSVTTHINDTDFLQRITRRGQRWGRMAGVSYAEAIITEGSAVYQDIPEVPWI